MNIRDTFVNIIIFLTAFLIFVIDVIYYISKAEFLGKFGVYVWYFSYLFFIVYAFFSLFNIFKISFKIKSFISFFSLLFIIFIVLLNTVNPKNVSGETTVETTCAINHLLFSPDLGFWKTCLYGYPARQYYLSVAPSLLFGRNLFALNFGGSFYFLIGLPIFVYGLWFLLPHKKTFDYLIGAILISFFHLNSFNFLMFQYEQSIFPFSMTLMAGGLSLTYFYTKKKSALLLIWLLMLYLIYSYTTSLFSLSLLFLFLLVIIFVEKNKWFKIFIFISVIINLFFSFQLRNDLNIFDGTVRNLNLVNKDILDTFIHIFFQNKGIAFVSPVFNFILLFFLFGSLFLAFGIEYALIGLWIALVILFSIISKGYSYYGIDFRLNRSIVIFPVLFILIANLIKNFIQSVSGREKHIWPVIIFIFLFLFGTGYCYQYSYIQSKSISKHYQFIEWLNKQTMNKKNSIFLFDSDQEIDYASINDSFQYFLPRTESRIVKEDCKLYSNLNKNIFLLTQNINDSDCKKYFNKIVSIKEYKTEDKNLNFYQLSK